jgi:hypothetical protein
LLIVTLATVAATPESIVTDPVDERASLELGVVEVSVAVLVIAPAWATLKVIVSVAVAPLARAPTVQVNVRVPPL